MSYGILTAVNAADILFEYLHLIDKAVSQENPPPPRALEYRTLSVSVISTNSSLLMVSMMDLVSNYKRWLRICSDILVMMIVIHSFLYK